MKATKVVFHGIVAGLAFAVCGSLLAEDLSDAVKAKLQFWVAADDAAHLSTGATDGHLFWYDKRETDASAPRYLYAESSDTLPELVTYKGRDAVDFGGLGSGKYMTWKSPGGTKVQMSAYNIRHVFAVMATRDPSGDVFGTVDNDNYCGFTSNPGGLANPFFWNSGWSVVINGRAYLDGRRFDGFHKTPGKTIHNHGLHLLEVETACWKGASANAFFRMSGKGSSGGGYLCEALSFTNVLTEAERVEVESYLLKRWSVIAPRADDVAFREGVQIAVGETVDLKEGFPVLAAAGDAFNVTSGAAGRQATRTVGEESDAIVKTGTGELAICGVLSDVKKIDVREGVLTLGRRPVNRDRLASPIPVDIPNNSFEEYSEGELVNGCKRPNAAGFHGWYSGGTGGNMPWIFNWAQWTSKSSEAESSSRSSWGQDTVRPPDGECAMMLRNNAGYWAYTTVTIPSAGVYELSLKIFGRVMSPNSQLGGSYSVTLMDAATKQTVADFGYLKYEDGSRYREKTLTANVREPGTYQLRFDYRIGGACVMDDLHLAKVAEIETEAWPVPGGDFELATLQRGTNTTNVSAENTHPDWTFSYSSGSSGETPLSVAIVTRMMNGAYVNQCGAGGVYNDSRAPAGGYVELLLRGTGASAATTFTAPAGRHYLRCQTAFHHTAPATLSASVTVGEDVISLGTIKPDNKVMRTRCFPVPFELQTDETVTLTLTCTDGSSTKGAWVDDVALVPYNDDASDDNLVVNGDFEATTGWSAAGIVANVIIGSSYSGNPGVFGSDPSEGLNFLRMGRSGGACRTVSFPSAGRYRLRFAYRNWNNGFATLPVVVSLARNGVTNQLCRAGVERTDNANNYLKFVDEVADFDITDPGDDYSLIIQGLTSAGQAPQAIVDDVEIHRIADRFDGSAPLLSEDLYLRMAEKSHVTLSFDGVQKIRRLTLGGQAVHGEVGAAEYPQYFSGQGRLNVVNNKGSMIIVR